MKAYLITMFVFLILTAFGAAGKSAEETKVGMGMAYFLRSLMCCGFAIWTGFLLF